MFLIDWHGTTGWYSRDATEGSWNVNTNVYAPIFFHQQRRIHQGKVETQTPRRITPHPPTSASTFQVVGQGTSSRLCLRVFVSVFAFSAGTAESGWTTGTEVGAASSGGKNLATL